MAAGGPTDHPLTDIVRFNLEVYNKTCDELVKEISKYVSLQDLFGMFDWVDNFSASKSDLDKFEKQLRNKLQELKNEAINNGWEIK
jgi:hypothetical protein